MPQFVSSTDAGDEPYPAIEAKRLIRHIEFLGSDSLEGRGTGTRGGEIAANYLAGEMAALGLKPIGDDSSYFQFIPMHGSRPLPSSEFEIVLPNKTHQLELGKDYLLYHSGAQTFIPKPVPLVFAGYGISATEFDYNDYQTLNVEGKIVVFFSGEPPSSHRSYFDGPTPTIHAVPEIKHRHAIARGALGTIMIPTPREKQGRDWQFWVNEFAFEDITLFYSVTTNFNVLLNPATAEILFADTPYSLRQLFEMDETNDLRSFPLAGAAAFRGHFRQRDFLASNVIGLWEGSDPLLKDSYVIVSAHYDHLGIGPAVQGDSIYNGVFDNAAGVAAVLEIARAFVALPKRPQRSVIFLFVTGEEKGLLGSTYYVDHPVVPLYKTIANLNVDGLAMFDTFNDVVGVGAELSTLGEHLQRVAHQLGLGVSPVPTPFSGSAAFARSDQMAFARGGVPSLLIMEGINYRHTSPEDGLNRMIEWGRRFYHSPFDDLSQPINFTAAVQHCQILFALCLSLANADVEPQWKTGTPYINVRLRSLAEKR
ncbi:MAG: M20/M25/M40 family metallo-hydrolase [candidate division KSB1 bacterium]|nr:M20/M25/M40 family metallo-hydrolase [candidate division KSB1 bacterium]